jgi:hypothetical protein
MTNKYTLPYRYQAIFNKMYKKMTLKIAPRLLSYQYRYTGIPVLRIRIRYPGSGAFLPPGYRIRDGAMV